MPSMSPTALRVLAAIFVVAAGVVLFAADQSRTFAALLILGNLLSLTAHFVERRTTRS